MNEVRPTGILQRYKIPVSGEHSSTRGNLADLERVTSLFIQFLKLLNFRLLIITNI